MIYALYKAIDRTFDFIADPIKAGVSYLIAKIPRRTRD